MKYDYFQDEKLNYEDIEVPDELLFMVRRTIAADRKKKAALRRHRMLKAAVSVAAVWFLCLTIGVNSSYAFAETAVKIPVVNTVAKAVVMRSYRPEIIAVYEEYKKISSHSKSPEEVAEIQPEETEPAVSNNEALMQEEVEEQQPIEQEPEEILEGLDAWKAEMTPEKFKEVTELYTPEMESRYAETPEKLRTILLAQLPEKEISLYGYHENGKTTGVALFVKDTYQYFDWNYMNDSKKLPDISCIDTDEDGSEEIVVLLYNKVSEIKEASKENIGESELPIEDVSQNNVSPSVSDNEIKGKESAKQEEKPQPEEIWIISLKEQTWTASILSIEDYENQILPKIKTESDDKPQQESEDTTVIEKIKEI